MAVEDGIFAALNSPGGLIGGTAAAVVTMAAMLRKYWLGDKVASATADGQVDLIQRLMDAADRAEKQAEITATRAEKMVDEANTRADKAYAERNEAYQKIGELTQQVRHLQEQVDQLQRTLNAKTP